MYTSKSTLFDGIWFVLSNAFRQADGRNLLSDKLTRIISSHWLSGFFVWRRNLSMKCIWRCLSSFATSLLYGRHTCDVSPSSLTTKILYAANTASASGSKWAPSPSSVVPHYHSGWSLIPTIERIPLHKWWSTIHHATVSRYALGVIWQPFCI